MANVPASNTVGDLVYQERYSGPTGVDEWKTISASEFEELATESFTERRVLRVVEHDMRNAGRKID